MLSNSKVSRRANLILLIHLAFVLVGVGSTQLGVILPALSRQLGLDDAQSGGLSAAQYVGSLLGTLVTNFLWRRLGFLPSLMLGLLGMAIGIGAIGLAHWTIVAIGIFINGLGVGLAIPTANLLVANLFRTRAAAALNILNFAWGSGALICPALFGLFGTQTDVRFPLFSLAMALFLVASSFILFKNNFAGVAADNQNDRNESVPVAASRLWLTPFAILIAALLFFYVGVENSCGYWLTSYALRLQSIENSLLSQTTIGFWAAFLLGRLCAPIGLKRLTATRLIFVCLLIATAGAAVLLATSNQLVLLIGALLTGFGLAPIFPTALALFTARFGAAANSEARWLFIASTFGGATITWLVGFFSKTFGNLRSGLLVAFVCCLLMIVLQAFLIKNENAASRKQHN